MSTTKVRLGEILISRKRLTDKQLQEALRHQRKEKGYIGEICVKLGFIHEQDIVAALVIQSGLPYIAVNKYSLDPSLVRLIPYAVAQNEHVIVLDRIGDILSVVMAHLLTEEKKNHLESLTRCRVAAFISSKTEISQAIACYYQEAKDPAWADRPPA